MRIGTKFALGFGGIALVMSMTGFATFDRVRNIVHATLDLAEIHAPQQEAIMEMEINLLQAAQTVFDFAANVEGRDIARFEGSTAVFLRQTEVWQGLAEEDHHPQDTYDIQATFHHVMLLGREIIHLAERHYAAIPLLQQDIVALDEDVDEKMQKLVEQHPTAPARASDIAVMLRLEVKIGEAFVAINTYQMVPTPSLRETLDKAAEEVVGLIAEFGSTDVGAVESDWLVKTEQTFNAIVAAGRAQMAQADLLREMRQRFAADVQDTETHLDELLQPIVTQATKVAIADAKYSADQVAFFLAFSGLFGLSIAIGAGIFLSHSVTRPIAKLTRAAEQIGQGEFGVKTGIRSRDEFGILATSMEDMSAQLEASTISRSYLDNILESLAECIVVIDTEGIICKVNTATTEMTGYAENEIVGQPATHILHDDLVFRVWQAGSEHPTIVNHVEGLVRSKAEQDIPVLFSATVMYRDDGRTHRIIVSVLDFSEQKRSRENLAFSEQRAKDFADAASDWFWETNANDEFSYISDKFFAQMKVEPDTVLGQTRRGFISTEELTNYPEKWRQHFDDLDHHQPFRNLEYAIDGEDGTRRYIKVSGVPIFDAGGNFMGYRGADTDFTEQKTVELELAAHRANLEQTVAQRTAELRENTKRLEEALAQAQEYNRLQRQFVSMASHEFRTPLAIIDATAQRLLRHSGDLTEEKLQRSGAKIRSAIVRMTGLIESTLSAARLDAGTIEFNPQECPLASIVQEVCERQAGLSKTHTIAVDVSEVSDVRIHADPKLMDQIFTNLLSNAVKYSPDDPRIDVKARRDGSRICVTVQDHGLGVSPDDLPKLFTSFFRAKTSTGIAGTGIGLNIVKQFLDLHRGDVTVESIEGEGSTFSVWLHIDFRSLPNDQSTDSNLNHSTTAQGAVRDAPEPLAQAAEFG